MHNFFVVLVALLIGCSESPKKPVSFWESKQDSFPLQQTKTFVSDSILRANYKNYPKENSKIIDSIFFNSNVYLHSWQKRDSTKNEFTVVLDDGELGLKIFYLVFNMKDSLISSTQIAGKGSEGGYWFETRSEFIAPDTLYSIGAITQWLDFNTLKPAQETKGDSTFSHLIFDKSGQINEVAIRKNFELNLAQDEL